MGKEKKKKHFTHLMYHRYLQIFIVLKETQETEKLAFATTFGLFEWLVLPFPLCNATEIFKRTIRRILNKYKIDYACNLEESLCWESLFYKLHLRGFYIPPKNVKIP